MSETVIWSEVFKRLPVKTLGKCRCVCKPWDDLIVSPSFISAHLKHYTQNEANSYLLFKHIPENPVRQEVYSLLDDSIEKSYRILQESYSFTSPFVPYQNPHHFRLIGSLNGLLCLSDDVFGYSCIVILWNPMLHKYMVLPPPTTIYTAPYTTVFGFGYDSRSDDHKVVRIVYMEDNKGLDITPPVVQVYSVQEETWSTISVVKVVDICLYRFWWSQCFLNGCIHWLSWERNSKTRVFSRNCLLLFDVEQGKFKKMKLPEGLSTMIGLNLRVSEYGGKLSVVYSLLKDGVAGKDMKSCEIWVKGEYSVGHSWSKVVSITLESCAPLGWAHCLTKSGSVLGFTKSGKLILYDPKTRHCEGVGLRALWRSWFTGGYAESLVLLDKKDGVYTYTDADCLKKKRYLYNSHDGSILLIEEEVGDGFEEGDKSAEIYDRSQYKEMLNELVAKKNGGSKICDFDDIGPVTGGDTKIYIRFPMPMPDV